MIGIVNSNHQLPDCPAKPERHAKRIVVGQAYQQRRGRRSRPSDRHSHNRTDQRFETRAYRTQTTTCRSFRRQTVANRRSLTTCSVFVSSKFRLRAVRSRRRTRQHCNRKCRSVSAKSTVFRRQRRSTARTFSTVRQAACRFRSARTSARASRSICRAQTSQQRHSAPRLRTLFWARSMASRSIRAVPTRRPARRSAR